MFGMSTEERRRYEADMQQLRAQRQAHLQANITTSDYRGQYNTAMNASGQSVSSDTSTILRNVRADMRGLHDEVTKLKGFYEWMIHAYPETIAQYKALMDLQRASTNNETGEQSVASSY
jgi:hypothetical protein